MVRCAFDGVVGAVEHWTGAQVCFAHPEGLLDVPELMVGTDYLGCSHSRYRNVRDVAFQAGELPGARQR
jgi:hypothetical protein